MQTRSREQLRIEEEDQFYKTAVLDLISAHLYNLQSDIYSVYVNLLQKPVWSQIQGIQG